MRKIVDLTGKKFGRLKVICLDHKIRGKRGSTLFWRCRCICGGKVVVRGGNLRSGHTRSCKCLMFDIAYKGDNHRIHGMKGTLEYNSWKGMNQRCRDKNLYNYDRYGGRGIRVCKRWRNDFLNFYNDMGPRPKGMTLDRKDNDGDYTLKNCRWATPKEQNANQGKYRRRRTNAELYHVVDVY